MQPTSRTRSEERNIKELIREGQGLKILVGVVACMHVLHFRLGFIITPA
jgi:hypothetical protein